MFVCQWHLDVPYGRQSEAVRIMTAWGREKMASSEFRRAKGTRLMAGFIGESASHIVDEYLFETLADFEAALAGMGQPQFRAHSDGLSAVVVPGSQRWVVYRLID